MALLAIRKLVIFKMLPFTLHPGMPEDLGINLGI